jgi:hypothetical protein
MLARKVCAAIAASTLLAASAARAQDEGPTTVVVHSAIAEAKPVAERDAVIFDDAIAGAARIDGQMVATMRGGYWLGVIASRPTPALQSQLKLPKDRGIVVEALEPESPAIKAGIQQYDILLKGNDKPLTGLHDLFQLTNEVKEGKLKLELLRGGKHETVTVTPVKRPAHEDHFSMMQVPDGPAAVWLQNRTEGGPVRFQVIHPGQILPATIGAAPIGGPDSSVAMNVEGMFYIKSNLADGFKVEITRKAPEAKIVVTRDKDKWEGTAKDLSKIPEKIRPEVEKMLHQAFEHNFAYAAQGPNFVYAAPGAPGMPGMGPTFVRAPVTAFTGPMPGGPPSPYAVPAVPAMPGAMAGPVPPGGGPAVPPGGGPVFFARTAGMGASPEIENRLAELQKQIEELRHSVDALKSENLKSKKAKDD